MIYDFDELSFQILTIVKPKHDEGFFNVKGRPFAALGFRIKGSGDFVVGEKSFTSKPGSIVFIPQNVSYKVKYTDGESIVVHFSQCNYDNVENINLENPTALYSKFNELLNCWNENYHVNAAKSLIYNILESITNNKAIHANDSEFIRCVNYIDNNFTDPDINIANVCKEIFISESSLRRKFQKYYNMSPKQYMLNLRINKSVELLTSGQYSVKDVSEICGFKDTKYFSRIIKKRFGQSPSELGKKFIL